MDNAVGGHDLIQKIEFAFIHYFLEIATNYRFIGLSGHGHLPDGALPVILKKGISPIF
jgi:hypothetical protein